jgi:hypothetical protein
MDDFYSRVKLLAKKQNATLREFIVSLDLNYDTYYSQKALKNFPRLDDAVRIARALGTTVEFLVTGSGPKPPASDKALDDILGIIEKCRRRPARKKP